MANFCKACGSLIIDDKCSNHKCPEGKRKRTINFGGQGYLRNKKTGVIVDKETGTTFVTRRKDNG
jgi:hypothetical protein